MNETKSPSVGTKGRTKSVLSEPEMIARIITLEGQSVGFKEELLRVKSVLENAENSITDLSRRHNRPWFKDRIFWAGVAALPSLIIGGWALDSFLPYDGALRSLHASFGTQKAVSDTFREDKDYQNVFFEQMANEIQPGSTVIVDAMKKVLATTFLERDSFKTYLDNEISKSARVLGVDMKSIGLFDATKIAVGVTDSVTGSCVLNVEVGKDTETCVDYTGALLTDTTMLFAAAPGRIVDISIGLNIQEFSIEKLTSDADGSTDYYSDVTGSRSLNDVLEVRIESSEDPVIFEDQGQLLVNNIDGKSVRLHHFVAKNVDLRSRAGRKEFPLHGLSIRLKPGAENLTLSLPIIVSRASD